MGPRDNLHVVDKRKILVPDRNRTPDRASRSLVSRTTLFCFLYRVSITYGVDI